MVDIFKPNSFSIVVFNILNKLEKSNYFFMFIIPYNWIQATQAIVMLLLTIFGLFLPATIFIFFGFTLVIWVTFSLWRIGKEEIGLTGWGAAGMILVSVLIEAFIGLFSRYLSKLFI